MEKRKQLTPSEIREKRRYSIFDAGYLWKIFVCHWKWFALVWILCLCLAAVYIYFGRPGYLIRGRMIIVEKRNNSAASAAMALQGQLPFGLGSSLSSNVGVENEKEILQSRLIARDAVKTLGLHTEYRIKKWFRSRVVYGNQPVSVSVSSEMLDSMDNKLPMVKQRINLTIEKSDEGYLVEVICRENRKKNKLPEQTFKKLPAVIQTDLGELRLTENRFLEPRQQKQFSKGYTMTVEILPPMMAAQRFTKKMQVNSASKKATYTVNLDLTDENIMRGIAYVNGVIDAYNNMSNAVKHKEVARNDEFVNQRLAKLDAALDSADSKWEESKKRYQVTDPKVDAEEVMEKKSAYESQIVNLGIQQQLLDYLNEYVNDPANLYELIPVNVGVYTGDVVSMITRHNQLVTDRKMLQKSLTEQSTQVKMTTQLIDELHPVIQTAFKRDKESLLLRKRAAEREYNKYMSRVTNVPEQERVLTEVSRNRSIKQGVYMTLLQKREDNAMELATITEKGRKIDETVFLKKSKPKMIVALAMVVLGTLLPYIVFFTRRSMKRRVETEVDLKLLTSLPLIGTIPMEQTDHEELFRVLRNGLLFHLKDGRKTVLVTSSGEGDGKTFCAKHLAEAFAYIGEKTVICDCNLHHPSLAKEFGISEHTGLTALLHHQSIDREAVISAVLKTEIEGLDVLPAGNDNTIHPADMLAHKNLHRVLDCLRETYDIVVLDGIAVGRYSDILINGLADVTLYVCRSGKSLKADIDHLEKMNNEKRVAPVCLLLNRIG